MERVAAPEVFDIHRAFSETEYAQTMAERVRYERYKPEDASNERWVELLGADVNNFTHLPLTYGLTRSFIHYSEVADPYLLNTEDKQLLMTAALIHDWAEAIVGDKTYNDNDEAAKHEERREFEARLREFYPGDSKEIITLIQTAVDEIVFSPDTRLGKMFNAIERVGYIRTGLRANQHVRDGTAPDCDAGLQWLTVDVVSNHIVKLTEYAAELPAVAHYLWAQQPEISEAFFMIDNKTFERYNPDEIAKRKSMVGAGLLAWQRWLATSSW